MVCFCHSSAPRASTPAAAAQSKGAMARRKFRMAQLKTSDLKNNYMNECVVPEGELTMCKGADAVNEDEQARFDVNNVDSGARCDRTLNIKLSLLVLISWSNKLSLG